METLTLQFLFNKQWSFFHETFLVEVIELLADIAVQLFDCTRSTVASSSADEKGTTITLV